MDVHSNYSDFFEGTEKLLEVWFCRTDGKDDNCDLRKISREQWESLLQEVKCVIISFKRSEHLDSYVLSESSMFVSKRCFILKTCGSTTLLNAVTPLLYIVKMTTGFNFVQDIFYSRKNFMRPELQNKPHTSFEDEIESLEGIFEDGAAYCMGRINSDCWYLYTLNTPLGLHGNPVADQTLEVIMQDLDQNVMSIFTQEGSSSARDATQKSGIDQIYPGAMLDEYLFDPCGYSVNGILKGRYYFTIHITPEPHCSYVSFETNAPQDNYHDLVNTLLKMFLPGKFVMTLFANKLSVAAKGMKESCNTEFHSYNRKELQVCRFNAYDLTYALFAKAPS
uniref:S-adenosylmethionine decarboxylase proenzyme n=1 Tax=Hyalomma excavatum TaxID=257692 RepID=A0A131X8Z0_9ACAR